MDPLACLRWAPAAAVIILIINAKLRGLGKKSIVAAALRRGTGLESQV